MHTYCISATQSTYIRLEEKYSLESTDPRESEIPPAAAGARHRRWPRRGPGPAGQDVALRPALRFIVQKHLLIYDVHMYQCIDIH